MDENKNIVKVYDEYYKCGTCESTYHISNFRGRDFECRDCGHNSIVTDDAIKKAREYNRGK
jgi:DNA-directed RNA polymerase subunit RPC12/RpoP